MTYDSPKRKKNGNKTSQFRNASSAEVLPDAEESEKFWLSIWESEVQHNKNAKWLKELKEECGEVKHDEMMITFASIKEHAKKYQIGSRQDQMGFKDTG